MDQETIRASARELLQIEEQLERAIAETRYRLSAIQNVCAHPDATEDSVLGVWKLWKCPDCGLFFSKGGSNGSSID